MQLGLADLRVALVLAVERAAVGEEMLRGGKHMVPGERLAGDEIALQAQGHRLGISRDQLGVRGIAFIAAAPAQVLRHRDGWRERPFDARGADLVRGRLANPSDEGRVVGRAKPDIVRVDRRVGQVAVAVDGVDPEQDRDRDSIGGGLERGGAEARDQAVPVGGAAAFVAVRPAIAPAMTDPSG